MPRIGYFPVEDLVDPELRSAVLSAARHGLPRPEAQAVRAHAPEVLRAFTRAFERTYRQGVCDEEVKELCRLYVEDPGAIDAVRLDEREQAALDYAAAIATHPGGGGEELWTRLRRWFSDAELVELGWFVGLVHGQQRFLATVRCSTREVRSLNRAAAHA